MASTVMATTKITPSLSTSRKLTIVAQLKPVSTSKRTFSAKLLFSAIPSMAMIAASNPLPAMAVMEKAALFDFNLTLPAIAIEFLILMVALDKLYFTPLGNFMDERDRKIREELNSVKDTSAEVKELEEKAAAIMNAARAEVANALNKMKKETTAELEAMLEEGLAAIEKEMAESMANIEKERDEIIAELNAQIDSLSEEIADKILPKVEAEVTV